MNIIVQCAPTLQLADLNIGASIPLSYIVVVHTIKAQSHVYNGTFLFDMTDNLSTELFWLVMP